MATITNQAINPSFEKAALPSELVVDPEHPGLYLLTDPTLVQDSGHPGLYMLGTS